MKLSYTFVVVLSLLLVGCSVVKKTETATAVISITDYAYIQHFHEGIRFKTTGQYDEAIRSFEQCLAVKQTDDAVYYALAQIY